MAVLTPQQQGDLYGYIIELRQIREQLRQDENASVNVGTIPHIVGDLCRRKVTITQDEVTALDDLIIKLDEVLSEASQGRSITLLGAGPPAKICRGQD